MKDISTDAGTRRLLDRLGAVLSELEAKGISADDALGAAGEARGIPFSIFNRDLGALESIVKYMKEELLMDYGSIAYLLGRNVGPVGVTYRRAKIKLSGRLNVPAGSSDKRSIPFEALRANKKLRLSVLESLVWWLTVQGYDWHDVAAILARDDKTIWTVLDRARKKMKRNRQ